MHVSKQYVASASAPNVSMIMLTHIAEQLCGAQSLNARFYAKALVEWENGFFDIKGRQVQNENK